MYRLRIFLKLVFLCFYNVVKAQNVVFHNPDKIVKPYGYSHIVEIPKGQKMIFVSGQLGLLPSGELVGDDFRSQVYQAFINVDEAIKSMGAKWKDVVKINMYLTDVKNQMQTLREVRDVFVNTEAPPASTTVEVSRLVIEGALFEIDAVVVVPKKLKRRK